MKKKKRSFSLGYGENGNDTLLNFEKMIKIHCLILKKMVKIHDFTVKMWYRFLALLCKNGIL